MSRNRTASFFFFKNKSRGTFFQLPNFCRFLPCLFVARSSPSCRRRRTGIVRITARQSRCSRASRAPTSGVTYVLVFCKERVFCVCIVIITFFFKFYCHHRLFSSISIVIITFFFCYYCIFVFWMARVGWGGCSRVSRALTSCVTYTLVFLWHFQGCHHLSLAHVAIPDFMPKMRVLGFG